VRGGDDGTTTTRATGEKHGDLAAERTLPEHTTAAMAMTARVKLAPNDKTAKTKRNGRVSGA